MSSCRSHSGFRLFEFGSSFSKGWVAGKVCAIHPMRSQPHPDAEPTFFLAAPGDPLCRGEYVHVLDSVRTHHIRGVTFRRVTLELNGWTMPIFVSENLLDIEVIPRLVEGFDDHEML